MWRGVSVDVPPNRLWPWLIQIRLAPYSYDWIDNGGRRSPRALRGLPDPVPGETFTAALGRPLGRVLSVTPGRQLTGRIGEVVMSYLLEPDGDGTRLLLKIASPWGWPLAPLLSVGDLVMARRQLLNFKRLAERDDHFAARAGGEAS
ncbi:polyketide cyclase [Mycobacterium sp. 1423905.2]|uniref:polyketide cyclase n=1 Tax=Mycobacterium sp. 1423905.2 TaxID=1856859 RepID=UPI0020A4282F|nr:polyketide cyclase [Mycobacterium sp. 1423905.2]